jgi:hypothetical protein
MSRFLGCTTITTWRILLCLHALMQYFKFIEFLLTIMSPACLILLWNFVREISSYLILSCLLYTMLFRP